MRTLLQTSFALILCLGIAPAMAEQQSPYKGGMRYTTVGQTPKMPGSAKTEGVQSTGVAQPEKAKAEAEGTKTEKDEAAAEKEEEPAKRVWNRYKALAAGQAAEEEEKEKAEAEAETEKAPDDERKDESAEAEAPAKTTGLSGLIESYERNKIRQSQMRSINLEPAKDKAASKAQEKSEDKED